MTTKPRTKSKKIVKQPTAVESALDKLLQSFEDLRYAEEDLGEQRTLMASAESFRDTRLEQYNAASALLCSLIKAE